MNKERKKPIPIKMMIIVVFLSSMTVLLTAYGVILFANWSASGERMAQQMASDLNEKIYSDLSVTLHAPFHINEAQYGVIQNEILDLDNPAGREKFFVGVLQAHGDAIYSFSYGSEQGEYYGARRNPEGEIEIMRNDATTGGNSWYYTVKEDLTAGDLVVQAGAFDPRTRAWYKVAAETGQPGYSPIYKHFVMDDLTVSAAWPVFDAQGALRGVMGAHMLLGDIGQYLSGTVHEYQGNTVILEKESGYLIANSLELDNFRIEEDGTLQRLLLSDIPGENFEQIYLNYLNSANTQFRYEGPGEDFYISVREIDLEGLGWVIITALPRSYFLADLIKTMWWAGLAATLLVILSVMAYLILIRKMMRPMDNLLSVAEGLASGDLTRRVSVERYDEIGIISQSMNRVGDTIQSLVENLESNVQERTKELNEANMELEESKDSLRLILDSSAEAIYGIDLMGNCTFCNQSCMRMLGYRHEEELLGQNMHRLIHHSKRNGDAYPEEECPILRSIIDNTGYESEDEVFWRQDGSFFDVEYHAYPQVKNGKVIGGVITFMDVTDRKEREAEIEYLNCHDLLTGLHNRRCFEENKGKFDKDDNLPLSIIFGDINGLKMANDIFGHTVGDQLIAKAAEILVKATGEENLVARVGGDEFIVLLPKTGREGAQKVLNRIRELMEDARVAAIKCTISLGFDTKIKPHQSLEEIMGNAENMMYKDKIMNRKTINKDTIDTIVGTLHKKSIREKEHSGMVEELCVNLGRRLKLSEPDISKLERAAYLHDIGKITVSDTILQADHLSEEEMELMRQHAATGYRILTLFDETLDLADHVYSHHEWWDGTGYPRNLQGEEIPLLARIISVVEAYDRMIHKEGFTEVDSVEARKEKALREIQEGAGTHFDPEVAREFVALMEEQSS